MFDIDFYKGKTVLITGHTGFKGTWLCRLLINIGAKVIGYSLKPPTEPSLFKIAKMENNICSIIGDIRDYKKLKKVFDKERPEIVLHLAAQPIVEIGYSCPRYTYETNVMGTVNILECIRTSDFVKSFINVTTDKVYLNREWEWGYRENEELNGHDPYSNSKSCSELVTSSYKNSFFKESDGRVKIPISTVRAGNVIGGGDFSKNRIVPDCIRAAIENKEIIIRNPNSIRPYQHVLEPLYVYLMIAAKQYKNVSFAGSYNVGPNEVDCVSTSELVQVFINEWGTNIKWVVHGDKRFHEANILKLDCSKLKNTFNWKPRWDFSVAMQMVVEWSKCWLAGEDVLKCMDRQIIKFLETKVRT